MTQALMDAAARLAEALAQENLALEALDFHAAARLFPAKQAALTDFLSIRSQAGEVVAAVPAHEMRSVRDLAERLDRLATENRRLLERAMTVQGRLIATLARAARPEPSRYGANGGHAESRCAAALALSARA